MLFLVQLKLPKSKFYLETPKFRPKHEIETQSSEESHSIKEETVKNNGWATRKKTRGIHQEF